MTNNLSEEVWAMDDRIKLAEAFPRFLDKVQMGESCWTWIAGMARGGYGRFYVGGKAMRAHRYSWMFYIGPIPDGMYICHTCDNRACVNPEHLFIGTAADNSADMKRKGRSQAGENNGRDKLTNSDVLDIRASSQHYKTLCKRFDVSYSTIHKIKRRVTWTHI